MLRAQGRLAVGDQGDVMGGDRAVDQADRPGGLGDQRLVALEGMVGAEDGSTPPRGSW
jgi:hypothetical protein